MRMLKRIGTRIENGMCWGVAVILTVVVLFFALWEITAEQVVEKKNG